MHDDNEELPDTTIERHGKGAAQIFFVHCADVATIDSAAFTDRGMLIRERLLTAYPDARVSVTDQGPHLLRMTDRAQPGWGEIRTIDLYRHILEWDELVVELGHAGPFREVRMRTSRPLYPQEVELLRADHQLVVKLVTEDFGDNPLYSLVPELGAPTVPNPVLMRFLHARNASRG